MTTQPSPEKKALAYAESLGLNSVYEEAQAKRKALDGHQETLWQHHQERRRLEMFKQDLEMEVSEDERGKNPEMSVTAFEKHMKVIIHFNGDIRQARDDLASLAGEIELVEHWIDQTRQDIKIAVARLHELGGYFQFMAVVKQANESRKSRESSDDGNPWK